MQRHQFKVIVIGDSAVGKTSLLEQFFTQRFSSLYKPTIGTDFTTKEIQLENALVKLNIWDTAGQETWCQQMGVAYYRGADCCVFVYDLSAASSLQNIQKWYENFKSCNSSCQPLFLVGNKADKLLADQQDDSWVQVAELLKIPHDQCFKCSAKTGLNIQQLFRKVAEVCVDQCANDDVNLAESFVIHSVVDVEQPKPPKGGCC